MNGNSAATASVDPLAHAPDSNNPGRTIPGLFRSPQSLVVATSFGVVAMLGINNAHAEDNPDRRNFVISPSEDTEVSLSGHINRGLLITDDGEETMLHHVDTNTSSSRFRILGTRTAPGGTTIGTRFEWEFRVNNSFNVDQTDQFRRTGRDDNAFRNRHGEFFIENDDFGKLWVGQGWKAAEAAAEADLSGTFIAGYSDVRTIGGGMFLRLEDEPAATQDANNLGGDDDPVAGALGDRPRMNQVMWNLSSPRGTRVRYDTPRFGGLQLRASLIREDQFDLAASWEGDVGRVQVDARAAYQKTSRDRGLRDFQGVRIGDSISGSVSVLDQTGFNFTLAGGVADKDEGSDMEMYYSKVGWRGDLNTAGETALSLDFQQTEDYQVQEMRGRLWGIQAVQSIDSWGAEFYASARYFDFDHPDFDFENMTVGLVGTRVAF